MSLKDKVIKHHFLPESEWYYEHKNVKEAVLDLEDFQYYYSMWHGESSISIIEFVNKEKYFLDKYNISFKENDLNTAIEKILGDF